MKKYRIPRKLKKKIRRNPKLITEALMESYLINTPIFKEMRRRLDVLFIGADFREIELK